MSQELKDFVIGLIIMAVVILGAFWLSDRGHATSLPVNDSCNTNGNAGGLGC